MGKEIALPETIPELAAHFGGDLNAFGNDIKKFVSSELLEQFLYIKPGTKKEIGYCTHCEKEINLKEKWPGEYFHWKHNNCVMCPNCGHRVTVKTRETSMRQEALFNWWEKSKLSKDAITCRCIYLEKSWVKGEHETPYFKMKTDSAAVFVYGKGAVMAIPDNGQAIASYFNWDLRDTIAYKLAPGVHSRRGAFMQRSGIVFKDTPETIRRAIKGTPFAWMQYNEFCKRAASSGYNAWDWETMAFAMFAKYRAWEWLAKMGLWETLLRYACGDKWIGKLFNWRGGTVDKIFRCHISKQDKAQLYQGFVKAESLRALSKWKPAFPETTLDIIARLEYRIGAIDFWDRPGAGILARNVNPGKLLKYRLEQEGRGGNWTIRDYLDYLEQLETVHADLTDKRALFPKDFQEAHRRLSKRIEQVKNKKLEEKYSKRKRQLQKKYEYRDDRRGLAVIVPPELYSLVEEGEHQNNCVGGYMGRVARGETDVVFLRRTALPEESYVTVEVSPRTQKIIQARERCNRDISSEETKAFLREFENHLQERRKAV